MTQRVVKCVKGFHNWVTLDHRNQHWPIPSTGTTSVFLEINGVEISRAGNDDVYDLVIDVAAGKPTVDAIAERLRQLAT